MRTLLHRRVKVITVIISLLCLKTCLNIPESTGYSSLVSPEVIQRADKNANQGVDADTLWLGSC